MFLKEKYKLSKKDSDDIILKYSFNKELNKYILFDQKKQLTKNKDSIKEESDVSNLTDVNEEFKLFLINRGVIKKDYGIEELKFNGEYGFWLREFDHYKSSIFTTTKQLYSPANPLQ